MREDVKVLLKTESHVVEHIKGVEIEIVSDKLITHTKSELPRLHTHKLGLSFSAAEELHARLGQMINVAKELAEENRAVIHE